jgi:HAD superfamily hydrolase (TIGR01509 family)
MIKAVIFDFDGVIVDSHGVINRHFTKVANDELHLGITETDFARFPGMRFEAKVAILAKERGLDIPKEKIVEAVKKGREEYLHNKSDQVELYPGTLRLFDELKKAKIKIALGTNGSRRSVEKLTVKLGIKDYFDSIVTFDDAYLPKPAPHIFLKNAENLKCLSGDCLIVEDSIEGITAAKAAGMKVVGVSTTLDKNDLKDADLILKTINDLNLGIIQKL